MTKAKFKLNSQIKKSKDLWDKWPVESQIYRYTQLLSKENRYRNELREKTQEDPEGFQMRFLFEGEEDREAFIREMLVDLKFKVLFFLHILIEREDKDAILFAMKELIQKGFVNEEIKSIDEKTLNQLDQFFKLKTGAS